MGMIQTVKDEIEIIKDRDPALHSVWEVFLYPSFWAILSYRRAHRQYRRDIIFARGGFHREAPGRRA